MKIGRRNTLPEVEVKVKEECPIDEEEGFFLSSVDNTETQ